MILNDREIIYIKYASDYNWVDLLPKSNWLCILVDHDRPRNYIDEVISKLINNEVAWISTVGQSCEKNHDLADDEIQFRQVDIDNLYLPKHDIMTTWHNDFDDGIWFSIFSANDEDVMIEKVVLLDMTDGRELERINNLLNKFSLDE